MAFSSGLSPATASVGRGSCGADAGSARQTPQTLRPIVEDLLRPVLLEIAPQAVVLHVDRDKDAASRMYRH